LGADEREPNDTGGTSETQAGVVGPRGGNEVAPKPQQVASNEWGAISYYPEWKTLELRWGQRRDEHIVPLYNEAGVKKFAFLVTDRMPGTVEKGADPVLDGPATFPTGGSKPATGCTRG
jgi:hypothetical protein